MTNVRNVQDFPVISPYGNMYIYNLGSGTKTVTVAATDTWYQIDSGVTNGITDGFTFQNARELVCTVAGIYKISWSLGLACPANNQQVEATVMINAVAQTRFAAHDNLPNLGSAEACGGSGIASLAVGDIVSLAVLNHTAIQNITIDHLTCTITRVG